MARAAMLSIETLTNRQPRADRPAPMTRRIARPLHVVQAPDGRWFVSLPIAAGIMAFGGVIDFLLIPLIGMIR